MIGEGCRVPEAQLVKAADSPYKPSTAAATLGRVVIATPYSHVKGIDFRGCYVETKADGIIFEDCLFDLSVGAFCLRQWIGSGTIIRNSTFRGTKQGGSGVAFAANDAVAYVTHSRFEFLPADAVHMVAGHFMFNSVQSIGWQAGAHADAVCIRRTLGAFKAAFNFIDIRYNGETVEANNAFRIIPEIGAVTERIELDDNVVLASGDGAMFGIDVNASQVYVRRNRLSRGSGAYLYQPRPNSLWWQGNVEFETGLGIALV